MISKRKYTQKKLLKKYGKYGFNSEKELEKLDTLFIDYLKHDLTKKNEENYKKIKELEEERLKQNIPIDFSDKFISENFTLDFLNIS